jgi:hypothetical protein
MLDEQTTFTYYALSVKGGFYGGNGQIVNEIGDAQFFMSKECAIAFRKQYDPIHLVSCSILLAVQILVSEVEDY